MVDLMMEVLKMNGFIIGDIEWLDGMVESFKNRLGVLY